MCSSFYFLRFPDSHNPNELIRKALAEKMFPVDLYTGGKEHTVGHLLYSRFIHKFLYDQGYVNCPEPFAKLVHQGMILGSDGRKMGKRYGNVIDPLDVVASYGSDAVRTYLMFMGPVEQEKIRNDNALKGIKKFLDRIERACLTPKTLEVSNDVEKTQKSLESLLHKTIKTLSEDMEKMKYNTSVSKLMILLNAIEDTGSLVSKETLEIYLQLLAPFAPKIAQDMREKFGHQNDITVCPWPQFDAEKALDDEIIIPVQINGKRRLELVVSADADETMLMDVFRGTEDF
jgi:leucyl-tRNA synthetase